MHNAPSVTLTPVGSILSVTIENNGTVDRIGPQAAADLRNAFEFFETDDLLKILIIEGSGGIFSEGSTLLPNDIATFDGLAIDLIQQYQIANHLGRITKPTIAAIDGSAHGQGLEIALACDIRIASSTASFGFPESNIGLIPWDGGTQRLPRLVGQGLATQMLLTGKLLTAKDALESGLITEMVEPSNLHQMALEIGNHIATSAPVAAKYIKEAIRSSEDLPLREGFRLEADLNMLLFSVSDRSEGISSFLEKRNPDFRGD